MESLSNYFSKIFKSSADTNELMKDCSVQKLQSDANAGNPNKAWRKRLKHCKCSSVKPMDPNTPIKKDFIRFVCISDTHTKLEQFKNLEIPAGDVLLHAGDFSMFGLPDEIDVVNKYLGTLPHKYKVIIAGNHDNAFDLDLIKQKRSTRIWTLNEENYECRLEHFGVKTVHEMLTDCIYLQDSMTEIYGIKIYGSPWTPGHGSWGFQRIRGQALMKKWNQIPTDTDILLTHCPPCGFGDNVNAGAACKLKALAGSFSADHVGCVDLLNTVQTRVKPKYHVYGHIHEGYGVRTDGITTYINASTCTELYDPRNPAIVFDIPVPPGYSKMHDDHDLQNNIDICNNFEGLNVNEDNCDTEEDISELSEDGRDSVDSNDGTDSSDVRKGDSAEHEELYNETSCSGFLETVEEDREADGVNDVDVHEVDESDDASGDGDADKYDDTNEADKNDDDSLDDIFFHCSTYSVGDSVSASNKDGAESDDEDSNIVFDIEPEFDSGGKE